METAPLRYGLSCVWNASVRFAWKRFRIRLAHYALTDCAVTCLTGANP